ncbi:MAG TPA: hypothetical protein VK783_11645 [Bacteroidia bacterium]|jgi:hypothetical protein|nr:hypothetical protein [Bacteroidia bacterium]
MKKIYSNLKKLMPVAILAIVFSMLASCSSSNQFTSSFSKRKYMTGHYSDPVAKVKVEIRNTANVASTDVKEAVSESKMSLNKEVGKISESYTAADQKLSNYKAVQPALVSKHSSEKNMTNGLTAAADSKKNVNTIEQNSSATSSPDSIEKTTGDGGGHHHYLGLFFLCLFLGLIFLLLAAASVVGGSAAGLGLFAILAYLMWVAAIVFLILWIISLVA